MASYAERFFFEQDSGASFGSPIVGASDSPAAQETEVMTSLHQNDNADRKEVAALAPPSRRFMRA